MSVIYRSTNGCRGHGASNSNVPGSAERRAGLQRDSHRHVLEATDSVIGLFPELVEHLEATRKPVRDEDMRQAVAQGIAGHAWRFVQAMSIRTIILAAGILVAAMLISGAVGWWLRGHSELVIGVNVAPEKCETKPDGTVLCWLPVWRRPPPDLGR